MSTTRLLRASNPEDFQLWKRICDANPYIDIFFYPEYLLLSEKNNEGEAYCYLFQQNQHDFILYPFLKRRLDSINSSVKNYYDISSPYGYGGYLRSQPCTCNFEDFYRLFSHMCASNNIVSEFVRFNPWLHTAADSNQFITIKLWNQVVSIDLTKSEEDIWADFDSKNRNRIRKSIKCEIIIRNDPHFDHFDRFRILYDQTMVRHCASSYYYFKNEFFYNLKDLLSKNITLFHAFKNDKIIASMLILFNSQFAHAFLACSDNNYIQFSPNNLLFYRACIWAKTKNCLLFTLGGGKTASLDDSLLRFKKRFSKTLHSFWLGKKIHNRQIYINLCRKKIELEKNNIALIENPAFFPFYRRN